MQITQEFRVCGAKCFNGDVEGKKYDSTTLFVEMDLSERGGNAVGKNTVEMKFGKSDEFEKMKHLPFPLVAELTLNLTTKGYEVEGFKAKSAAPAQIKP
jgi:hypothetical protein